VLLVGRGASCGIVVDDPRASRVHAAVETGLPVTLRDLDSANGTFVGGTRLRSGESRSLAAGETFFIGDTALSLRPSGLTPVPESRFASAARLTALRSTPGEPSAPGSDRTNVVVAARLTDPAHAAWAEMILAPLCETPDDWIMQIDETGVAIGLHGRSWRDRVPLEREALSRLAAWGLRATAQSICVPGVGRVATARDAVALLGRDVPVPSDPDVVFRDPSMNDVLRVVTRIAAAPVNVLVLGETGAGKDVVASLLHRTSERAGKPFVRLNCAALPEGLLESELFGYERGAFTGAVAAKTGLLETADGGTAFLDEIGDLALPLQAKLLRAIESREVTHVGGLRPRRIDVRFVAATNVSLEDAIGAGRFRRDLYYRLAGLVLTIPPLRERRADIEPLARLFADGACARFDMPRVELSRAALEVLQAHGWPGNVRELRNVIERAVVLVDALVIEPRHLGLLGDAKARAAHTTPSPEPSPPITIEAALERCGGNQSRAAKLLGVSRRTIVRRIGALRLPRPRADRVDRP
jgi:transcriptional regulator with AAA-type ATPase domain